MPNHLPKAENQNRVVAVVHDEGVLTKREQFILSLVRTRKGFDVKSVADRV